MSGMTKNKLGILPKHLYEEVCKYGSGHWWFAPNRPDRKEEVNQSKSGCTLRCHGSWQVTPPKEGIFFEGQVFDAHAFVSGLVKNAKKSLVIIDNFIDESVLVLFSKRAKNVSPRLELDVRKFNEQYPPITIKAFARAHDRFLIVDSTTVYHIGASLKDLGKKWFAFSKMDLAAVDVLKAAGEV